jgi:hypothetical protein
MYLRYTVYNENEWLKLTQDRVQLQSIWEMGENSCFIHTRRIFLQLLYEIYFDYFSSPPHEIFRVIAQDIESWGITVCGII